MTSQEIRSAFLDFFKSKEHLIVPSAPMVVKNDPTLMFTNAGMNQFKDYFLGNATPKCRRVADTQKCLRVSGKHNDLEEVGHDTYHHTMFEMLGNWSFGDYFKKEAIAWAWELLTGVLKIDKSRMYATVFEGDKANGVEQDSEALELWKQFLPTSQIIYGNKKDNFWEMGDTGPCGPCTEIHVDLRSDAERAEVDGATLVNKGLPTVIEIWNLVFIQFNRKANGSLEALPAKHVDTGMGFERLCMVLQGKKSSYDTDIFQTIISEIAALSGKKYGDDAACDVAMRVIADHLRAVSFSIADGQLPGNVKAGYVIRRILRRAVRYGFTFLGFNEPFICKLVPILVAQMGKHFPELEAQKTLVEKVIAEEEATFLRTLEIGIRLLDSEIEKLQKESKTQIDGKTAFVLYDTYGFPFDLTELMAREKGLTVDQKTFEQELNAQKDRSRNAAAVEAGDWVEVNPGADFKFVGYDTCEAEACIRRYRKVKSKGKEQYQIALNVTPFYGESGGQQGDTGYLQSAGERIEVLNTHKENNLTVHITARLPQNADAPLLAVVDVEKRTATANNHSATHLLHHALREVLGKHVEQKGSMVSPNGLRFDFSHFQKVSDEEVVRVEQLVNKLIRKNSALVEHRSVPMKAAKELGAMALFGEKYGDSVRVIQLGDSVELCGGTHVKATGQIGLFKITSEAAISAGVRRIEAVTGENAEQVLYGLQSLFREIGAFFHNTPNLVSAIKKTIGENADLQKQVERYVKERIATLKCDLLSRAVDKGDYRLVQLQRGAQVDAQMDVPPDFAKELAFQLRATASDIVFAMASVSGGKPAITLMLGDDMVKKGLNASQIVREAAKHIEGSGGGQPFFATAGGKNCDGLSAALQKIIELIDRQIEEK
ncbi:MAG: alanine--tRNA ligase [Prevotellaceae bacterium]|jgi:alanyl-tRNA synthetase|nr:alanine--tRNA ligase [Prevotellaceae bacterium]